MKKLTSILLVILAILSITAIGCKSQNQSNNTAQNKSETDNFETRVNSPKEQAIFEENEEKDNTEINNRYKNVDKSKLDYTKSYSSNTYYETKNSFVGSKAGVPKIDNKKYMEILKDYTYASEVNPTNITYNEAIKLAKSVLPDDIKELQKKYDNDTAKTYITYSSSQGNFVVGFSYDYNQSHTDSFNPDSDKDIIVGIDYMKEIS